MSRYGWMLGLAAAVAGAQGAEPDAGMSPPATRPAGQEANSPQWQTIVDAWREASPLASSHQSTQKQRDAAEALLKKVQPAVRILVEKGEVSEAEGQLLVMEASRLREDMLQDPPIDARETCYDMMVLRPAKRSMDRLNKRLTLVQKMVEDGALHAAAVERIVPAIDAELRVLGDEKELAQLTAEERPAAEAIRTRMAEEMKRLKEKMSEKK